jgi:type II secretory ATPase GspE/PulE/Tfp pilus assembly ATPase PilB-like protein/putative methionine-R-sulfoxide reductase with GAF domain
MQEKSSSSKDSSENLRKSLEFQTRLNQLYGRIHSAQSFMDVLPELERDLLDLLRAERLTIYQRGRHDREIVSRYMTGKEIKEIRLPLSATSIAGYVALTQKSVRIDDVYDSGSLTAMHPDLKFDHRYDQRSGFRTRSMIVIPIKFGEIMLGVLQIINRIGGVFSEEDLAHAREVARVIGQKFRYDLNSTNGPFDYLIQKRRISPGQLAECKKHASAHKTTVTNMLITELRVTAEEIGASLEHYYQVPFMRYDPDLELPQPVLKKLNETYLRNNRWVPVSYDREKAVVLIDDPSDINRIMEIQKVLPARSYDIRVGIPEDILRFLGIGIEVAPSSANLEELIGRLEDESVVAEESDIGIASAISENEAAVVQIVNQLIVDADKLGASDIHIEPGKGKQTAEVRMRVDGICRSVLKIPASHIRAVVARIKVISRLDIAERRKPQDGKFAVKLRGKSVELRVATIPTVNGESAVMRLLHSGTVLPFDSLSLSERNREAIKELSLHPHGILLVVGPTGSGKTTTLHAILGQINTPERKIWTAEDPVEITQPGLQQLQVEPKIGLNFASALRSFLRADPDVILIGEIRDEETARSAIQASLTGHLVLSTLHTNSAPETVTRLLDLGLDPRNFADALLGVLAQRLVRTICPTCRQIYSASAAEAEELMDAYGREGFLELGVKPENIKMAKGTGCDRCVGTGYRGRMGIHELLLATDRMKSLVARRAQALEIRDLALTEGMRTLMQDGIAKISQGHTDFHQLRKVVAE